MVAWECIYCMGLVLVKLSILALYASIFPTRGFRIAVSILSFVTIGWGIAVIVVSIFQCHQVRKAWDATVPGHCISTIDFFYGNALPNILTDVCILVLPIRSIWKLHRR